jgi:hypothetical protein
MATDSVIGKGTKQGQVFCMKAIGDRFDATDALATGQERARFSVLETTRAMDTDCSGCGALDPILTKLGTCTVCNAPVYNGNKRTSVTIATSSGINLKAMFGLASGRRERVTLQGVNVDEVVKRLNGVEKG